MDNESRDAEQVFNRIDSNQDGKITAEELSTTVHRLDSNVTEREVEIMMDEMDANKDGCVDLKEFSTFNRNVGDVELKDAFDAYDVSKKGVITAKELHRVLHKLGEKSSLEDCEKMIQSVDRDGDGCVDFDEFKTMMTGGSAVV